MSVIITDKQSTEQRKGQRRKRNSLVTGSALDRRTHARLDRRVKVAQARMNRTNVEKAIAKAKLRLSILGLVVAWVWLIVEGTK